MPIYEYRCAACRTDFERLILRPARVVCPRCGGSQVERLLSRFAQRSERGLTGSAAGACGPCSAPSCAGCSLGRRAL